MGAADFQRKQFTTDHFQFTTEKRTKNSLAEESNELLNRTQTFSIQACTNLTILGVK